MGVGSQRNAILVELGKDWLAESQFLYDAIKTAK